MRHLSWNEIKNVVYGLVLVKSYVSSNRHVQRLLSFGSSNEHTEETLPVSSSPAETQQQPSLGLLPLMVEATGTSTTTTPQTTNSSSPVADEARRDSRSIAELAIPAALCVGIYGSIPADIQLKHQHLPLYNPLIAFICLGVFASLCSVVYALAKPGGGGGGGGDSIESTKRMVMGVAVGFLLVAFVLRILLLLPTNSLGLVGLLFFLGAAVAALLFFLPLKKEESHDLIAAEPAPDYSVQNRV